MAAADKEKHEIANANHYFSGATGKTHLSQAVDIITEWLAIRGFTR